MLVSVSAAGETTWPWRNTVFDQSDLPVAVATGLQFLPKQSLLVTYFSNIRLLGSVSVFFALYPNTWISLCFSLQWSDYRHSFRCPCWLDFLLGVVFPGCAVPPRPSHPPQESHEEVPGKRRGETSGTIHLVSCFGCYMHLFSSGNYSWVCFFGRALSRWVLGRKVPRFTPASWGPQSWRNLNPSAREFLEQWTRYLLTSLCLWTSTDYPLIYVQFKVLANFHRLMSTDLTALYI